MNARAVAAGVAVVLIFAVSVLVGVADGCSHAKTFALCFGADATDATP